MGVFAWILFGFGAYVLLRKLFGRRPSEDARVFGARLGRSAHGALPLPGLMGQAPVDPNPEVPPDGLTPDPAEGHVLVLPAAPPAAPPGPYRRPASARRDPSTSDA